MAWGIDRPDRVSWLSALFRAVLYSNPVWVSGSPQKIAR